MEFNDDGTTSFSLNSVGTISGQTYLGKFKFKCFLSPLEVIKADRLYRELLGRDFLLAEERCKGLAYALSQLKFRIIESPPFWKHEELNGGDIDDNILMEVLENAIKAEGLYRKKKREDSEKMKKNLLQVVETKKTEINEKKD